MNHDNVYRLTPVDVVGLSTGVTYVGATVFHTCAAIDSGGAKCWGDNDLGSLGDGTTVDRLTPVDVVGLSGGVEAITGSQQFTCALTSNGAVKCWGNNSEGHLGDGTTTHRHTPVDVIGLGSGVIALTTGGAHSCALTASGGVKCWGWNGYGQLGDGTITDRLTPVDVSGLDSDVVAISAGPGHTCALTNNGGVKCWGRNGYGQLGDGTKSDRLLPTYVGALDSNVVAISAGGRHTCALTSSGEVKCWGDNDKGQLGDGTTTIRLIPTPTSNLGDVVALSAGWYHTCAMITGGRLKCWGDNGSGQLGDGTTTHRLTPADVVGFSGEVSNLQDSDCDSLPDDWEDNGYNGVNLQELGASKNHKDIFVYADWFSLGNIVYRPNSVHNS